MTSKERLLNTLQGKPVDRVPVHPQLPFVLKADGFRPGAFHGYGDHDDWRERDPLYNEIIVRVEKECDSFFIWRPPCMLSEPFFIPLSLTRSKPPVEKDGMVVTTKVLKAAGGELRAVSAVQPGTGHTWEFEHFCKSPDDARMLLELPWEGHPPDIGDFHQLNLWLGNRGVFWVTIPSPLLVVCRLFDPMEFLMIIRDEEALVCELMDLAAERIGANLLALLQAGVGPIIRFGGAEHATPPIMSPKDFDRLVVKYDRPLMDMCRAHGCLVAVHCHGHLRHALQRFREMGVAQTDPVESVPDGDLTLREARAIASDKITLTGNIQMRELHTKKPEAIEERVREIIREAGPERLVVSTTGTPLERITPQLATNYHRLIDTVLEFGRT